ncbi:hypothetical protein NL332_27650, partial [Klebsiella pneumoniae]|nr:hypothetical protein [Klebsiella pneumoniae]
KKERPARQANSILCCGKNYGLGKSSDTLRKNQRIYACSRRLTRQPAELNKIRTFSVGKKWAKKTAM